MTARVMHKLRVARELLVVNRSKLYGETSIAYAGLRSVALQLRGSTAGMHKRPSITQ